LIHHKKRPILYVDDTVEQRYAMRRILETEGFAVLEAGTGKEAFALMQQAPALAVVDVRLPDISGYDLSRRLKEMEPYLPILQVSASFSDPDKRAAGFSGGADAYIAQPVHPSELVSLIRRMLRTSEAEESLRFLATIGPRLSSTLSLSEAAENIRTSMSPHFANRCFFYLQAFSGQPASFWPDDETLSPALRTELERESQSKSVTMATSRLLIAPLSATQAGFGAIAFQLDKDREYTATDVILAADLANRAGLSLQNCLLFASEQATRSALVQAEKLATAGRMSAAIAHEINNPLEALTNLIYILEQSPEASDNMREIASAALAEVTRLAHITRQTLGFYRELRAPSNLDLSDSVLDTLDIYRKRIESKKIDIVLELTDQVCIRGIKGEIRQVVSNLLVNAMEAMEAHGKLIFKTETQGSKAILSIEDSGPGIPQELQTSIFEPFFTTKQGTGTGLGLWITQTIVEKHEGEIVLTTHTGANHGTCFKLVFPRIDASQPANEAAGR
jgi:two-component system NtrC family sensor kinase